MSVLEMGPRYEMSRVRLWLVLCLCWWSNMSHLICENECWNKYGVFNIDNGNRVLAIRILLTWDRHTYRKKYTQTGGRTGQGLLYPSQLNIKCFFCWVAIKMLHYRYSVKCTIMLKSYHHFVNHCNTNTPIRITRLRSSAHFAKSQFYGFVQTKTFHTHLNCSLHQYLLWFPNQIRSLYW